MKIKAKHVFFFLKKPCIIGAAIVLTVSVASSLWRYSYNLVLSKTDMVWTQRMGLMVDSKTKAEQR